MRRSRFYWLLPFLMNMFMRRRFGYGYGYPGYGWRGRRRGGCCCLGYALPFLLLIPGLFLAANLLIH